MPVDGSAMVSTAITGIPALIAFASGRTKRLGASVSTAMPSVAVRVRSWKSLTAASSSMLGGATICALTWNWFAAYCAPAAISEAKFRLLVSLTKPTWISDGLFPPVVIVVDGELPQATRKRSSPSVRQQPVRKAELCASRRFACIDSSLTKQNRYDNEQGKENALSGGAHALLRNLHYGDRWLERTRRSELSSATASKITEPVAKSVQLIGTLK